MADRRRGGRRPAVRGGRGRGGGAGAGRGAGRAGGGAGPGARPGPRRTHRRLRPPGTPRGERAAGGGPGRGGDPRDRARRGAHPGRDPGAGTRRAPGVGPATALHAGGGGGPAGPGPGGGAGGGAAAAGRGHPARGDRRTERRPAVGGAAAGRAARGHRGARAGREGAAAGPGRRRHLPGAARPGRRLPGHRPAAPPGRVGVQPDRGAVPAHRAARPCAAGRAERAGPAPRALAAGDRPVRRRPDPGLRGGLPAGAERAAGRGLRSGHPGRPRHRAAPLPDPRPGRRRAAARAVRAVAGPQSGLPALRPGHRGPADPRPPVERGPARARDAAPARRGGGGRGGRPGGVRPGGGGARGPGQPGGGAVQPAGRARGGPGHRARLRGARRGPALDARRGGARPVRRRAGRVDRRRGPGRGPAAGGRTALAGRARRGPAAGRLDAGLRGPLRPVRPAAVGLRRLGRAAAPRRPAAAAAGPYARALAPARLEARPVRRRPGGRGRTRARPRHRHGDRRRPGARPGGRVPADAGRAPGTAARADALSRGPRGRPARGAAGTVRGCDSGHHTGRAAGTGPVRPPGRGRRGSARRTGGGGGAAPGRTAGVGGAVAARRTAARGGQRREHRPARTRCGAHPAPVGRPRTTSPASPLEPPSGPGTGGRPQGRPPRLGAPGPRTARPGPPAVRDRPGRCGEPLRAPRTRYAHATAGDGDDRAAHRYRRLDRRGRGRTGDAGVSGQPASEPARAYRARPCCLPRTRQHDRIPFRQSGTSPHSTGVHRPCSGDDGGWRRPGVPARTHPPH